MILVWFLEVKMDVPSIRYLTPTSKPPLSSCPHLERLMAKSGVMRLKELSFESGSSHCLKNKLDGFRVLSVMVSPGGRMAEARDLAEYLKSNNIAFHVDYLCASACVELMASAPKSSACYFVVVGNHQGKIFRGENFLSKIGNLITYPVSWILNRIDEKYQERAGVSPMGVTLRSQAGAESMSWIPSDRLVELGYVDTLIECS